MSETLTITQETLEDREVALTITVAPERVEKAMRQTARRLASQGRIPGFRPGKAPYEVILRHYGRDTVLNEVAEGLVSSIFPEALKETDLQPYAQPRLDEVALESMTFKIVVPLVPEVELGDYRSLRLPWVEPEVTEEQVEETLERLRRERSKPQEVERPVAYGDIVTVDIVGTVGDDPLIDQREFAHIPNDAEGGFVPGFDAAFVDRSVGDEWEFDLTYPVDSTSKWHGQTAHFKAKLLAVKERITPALDDDFARGLGDLADLAALRERIRSDLQTQEERRAENEYTGRLVDAILEHATIEYPPVLLEQTLDEMVEERDRQMRQQGASLQAYLELNQLDRSAYREQLRPQAERRAQVGLALGKLVDLEGIEVSDEDVEAELERMGSGLRDDMQDTWQELSHSDEFRRHVRTDLLTQRALEHLRAIARGEVPSEADGEVVEAPSEGEAEVSAMDEPASESSQEDSP